MKNEKGLVRKNVLLMTAFMLLFVIIVVGVANATVYINKATLSSSYSINENKTINISFKYYGNFSGSVSCNLNAKKNTTAINLISKGAELKNNQTNSTNGFCKFSWKPGFKDAGKYYLNFTVSDDNSSDSSETMLTVNKVNIAPKITSSPITSWYANESYTYQVTASDVNGDSLKYYLITNTTGTNKPTISSSGKVSWTPRNVGVYNLTVMVSDGSVNTTQSYALNVTERPVLIVNSIGAYVDGWYSSLANGSTMNVNPTSKIKLHLDVRNNYPSSSGVYLKDVVVRVSIPNFLDNGMDNYQNETNYVVIPPQGNILLNLNVDVPAVINEGNYIASVVITGDDSYNRYYSKKYTFNIDVKKKPNQLYTQNFDVFPTSVKCGEDVTFSADILNIGYFDQDKVKVKIYNSNLKLDHSDSDISIPSSSYASNSAYNYQYTYQIPNGTRDGNYNVTLHAYYGNTVLSDTKTVELSVVCPKPTPTPTPTPKPSNCVDSDKGLDFFTQGTVAGLYEGTPYTYVDSCSGNTLTEWYCDGDIAKSVKHDCGNNSVCSDGMCVKKEVTPVPTKTTNQSSKVNQTEAKEYIYRETPFTNTPYFIGILIGAVIGLVIIIILLVILAVQINKSNKVNKSGKSSKSKN